LKEKQDDIEKLIPVLTLRSLTAFDVKHKTSISSALLETQKAGLKSKIFFQVMLDARNMATGLFNSYHEKYKANLPPGTLHTSSIRLDLDLINDTALVVENYQNEEDLLLHYHLLIPWKMDVKDPLEFLIEGPVQMVTTTPMPAEGDGFLEACNAAEMNNNAEFKIQCIPEPRIFRVSNSDLHRDHLCSGALLYSYSHYFQRLWDFQGISKF